MQKLREWLALTGWSQAELARRIGVSAAQMSRIVASGPQHRAISKPIALAIEHTTTNAFRDGEVHAAPLRSSDLLTGVMPAEGSK